MKKIFTSKGFLVTSLSVLCIAILGICWYVGLDKSDPFLPDESPSASSAESPWSEDTALEDNKKGKAAQPTPPPCSRLHSLQRNILK